jgi:hypothetical protein
MYIDTWIEEFKGIIPIFKKEAKASLTWEQKVLMEKAYVEIGGHPFCKTCTNDVAETLNRMIVHTEALRKHLDNAPQRTHSLIPLTATKKQAEMEAKKRNIPMPRNISKEDLIELINSYE